MARSKDTSSSQNVCQNICPKGVKSVVFCCCHVIRMSARSRSGRKRPGGWLAATDLGSYGLVVLVSLALFARVGAPPSLWAVSLAARDFRPKVPCYAVKMRCVIMRVCDI